MKKAAVAVIITAVLATGFLFYLSRYEAVAATEAEFVANKKCKTCHPKVHKGQRKTAHALSFENLTDAGEETNKECLPCHTTGYGQPGGFVDIKTTKDLGGTTCQACHGPGSEHIKKGLEKAERAKTIQRTPKDVCTKCHKTHEPHPDIGAKSITSLKKKMERVQKRIAELEG